MGETCLSSLLNASAATGLTVDCSEGSCDGSTILCPDGDNTSCRIDCSDSTCDFMFIQSGDGNSMDTFSITCGYSRGCQYLSISIDSASVDHFLFECPGRDTTCLGSVLDIRAETVDNLQVECGYNSCGWMDVLAPLVDEIKTATITCYGIASCTALTIDIPEADALILDCSGFDSWRYDGVIFCPSEAERSSTIRQPDTDVYRTPPEIHVPEGYASDYLDLDCAGGSYACDTFTAHCEGYKGVQSTTLVYNSSAQTYYCTNSGASYCCPYRRCAYYTHSAHADNTNYSVALPNMSQATERIIKDNDTFIIFANDTIRWVADTIRCRQQHCVIQCAGLVSCIFVSFEINDPTTEQVEITCLEDYACLGSTVTSNATSPLRNISIVCSGSDSCNEMRINISAFDYFAIHCFGTDACQEMVINLHIDNADGGRTDNGTIHCVVSGACNDLTVRTNSEYTQLIMYAYSKDVIFDNGIGFLRDKHNILCNNQHWMEWIRFDGWIEDEGTVEQSLLAANGDQEFPCSAITVKCNDLECAMTYVIDTDLIDSLRSGSDTCYWIKAAEVQSMYCEGACQESPTSAPTIDPTQDPTLDPTAGPTRNPTADPSRDPSPDPTVDPTQDPTTDPTAAPTLDPTADPSANPTQDPSQDPTADPTC